MSATPLIPFIFDVYTFSAASKELLDAVRADIDRFVKDAPQFDDLTMMGVEYFG